ncbi:MAG: hypothetical protein ACIAQF_13595 [Phycisphaerales bacterium JB065]
MGDRVVLKSWGLAKRAWAYFVIGLILGIMICLPLVWDGVVRIQECALAWLALSSAATLSLTPAAWLHQNQRLVVSGLKVGTLFVPFVCRKCDSADSIVVWYLDHTGTSGRSMPVGWYVGINDGDKSTLYVHGPDRKRGSLAFKDELIAKLGIGKATIPRARN